MTRTKYIKVRANEEEVNNIRLLAAKLEKSPSDILRSLLEEEYKKQGII